MKKQNKESIVIMGSDQSFTGKGSSSVYGLTKGALPQLTKSTAIDYAPFNIRVNCICPGTIDTPLRHKSVAHFSSKSGKTTDEINESLNTMQPMGWSDGIRCDAGGNIWAAACGGAMAMILYLAVNGWVFLWVNLDLDVQRFYLTLLHSQTANPHVEKKWFF